MTNRFLTSGVLAALTLMAAPAHAQLNGENLLGDMGVKSGTQPAPGFYVGNIFYRYRTETIRNASGDRITFDPNRSGNQTINVAAPIVIYVSRAKILGANYGMMAVVPLAKGALEAPAVKGEPLTLRVTPGNPMATDPEATIAWTSDLWPEVKTDVEIRSLVAHGGGEPIQMLFRGHGFVVVNGRNRMEPLRSSLVKRLSSKIAALFV